MLLGSANDRLVKSYEKTVAKINELEPKYVALSDDEIHNLTSVFRERMKNGETETDILPDVFAAVREAAKRSIGLRHFDVQLIGGMVLNNGQISEMKTGEGKTLVATLALYLKALHGKGAHLITVNDYLASANYILSDENLRSKCEDENGGAWISNGACIVPMCPKDSDSCYYRVTTYIVVEVPFILPRLTVSVRGETKTIEYERGEQL